MFYVWHDKRKRHFRLPGEIEVKTSENVGQLQRLFFGLRVSDNFEVGSLAALQWKNWGDGSVRNICGFYHRELKRN